MASVSVFVQLAKQPNVRAQKKEIISVNCGKIEENSLKIKKEKFWER